MKKETTIQVFSFEFCENTFFKEHLLATISFFTLSIFESSYLVERLCATLDSKLTLCFCFPHLVVTSNTVTNFCICNHRNVVPRVGK